MKIIITALLCAVLGGANALAQDKQLERTAADAGFLIDGASRCGYPTAPIEEGLDRIFNNRGVSSSERIRLKGFMAEARRLAGQLPNATPAYNCDKVRGILADLGVRVR